MRKNSWFQTTEPRPTAFLLDRGGDGQEWRFHHLTRIVKRQGLDVEIINSEGLVLLQRLLSSDRQAANAGNECEDAEEVRRAMREVDSFMEAFPAVSKIVEGENLAIHIKSNEDLEREMFEITKERLERERLLKQPPKEGSLGDMRKSERKRD